MKKLFFKFILPMMIVAAGVAAMLVLKHQAKKATFTPPEQRVITVETQIVKSESLPYRIDASGSVRAAQEIRIVPEVGGRITWINENFIPGSRIKKGDIIAKIDNRDYKLALDQQMGQVQQAKLNLTLEKGRGEIAAEEWKMLENRSSNNDFSNDDSSMLALRKPQLQEANQREQSANSGLERAQLNLKKTVLRAPFDAIVIDKGVDVGQLVGPTTSVGTLMGSNELWVDVSVPVESLAAVRIPGLNSEFGSLVKIIQKAGNEEIIRNGEVIRLQGQLNSQNRTATLLVTIKNPFDMSNRLPLLAGAYVDVQIEGEVKDGVFEIPRSALKSQRYVWSVKNDHLKKISVTVAWKQKQSVIISSGLKDKDEIVISPMSFPLDDMKIKRVQKDESK
ncbi:MAG: efflux RND transporter periplasmic adaptor subunit [Deltaproteobacteria bacterium]|nr:efflux RND transporter periplasmic adaptor subunit [Deltaproteobacteria bacterium]